MNIDKFGFSEKLLLNISKTGNIDSSFFDFSELFPDILFDIQSQCTIHNKYYHIKFFNNDEELVSDFEVFKEFNPFPQAAIDASFDRVVSSKQLLDPKMIEQNEFYQNVCRPRAELDHGYGIMLHRRGSDAAFISAMVPKKYPEEEEAHLVKVLEAVRPHFQNAFHLLLSLHERRKHDSSRKFWLDRIPSAAFIVDQDLRLHQMNVSAEAMLNRTSVLKLEKGLRLSGHTRDADAKISRLVATALNTPVTTPLTNIKTDQGFAIAIHALALEAPRDVPASMFEFLRHSDHVLLIVLDPNDAPVMDLEILCGTLGLTEREAMLAAELINGLTLRESADRLEMSYNTARKHIANATGRGGLRSQADLIRLGTSVLTRRNKPTE